MVGFAVSKYPWLEPKRKVPSLTEAVGKGTQIVLHPQLVTDVLAIRSIGIEPWVAMSYRMRLLTRNAWNARQTGHPLYRPTSSERSRSQAQLRRYGKDALRLCRGTDDDLLLSLVPEDDRQAVLTAVSAMTENFLTDNQKTT